MYPKIRTTVAIEPTTLLVEFDNGIRKLYDVSPLLEREVFQPLRKWSVFKGVTVEPGGYAVSWNSEIDISEFELWTHGKQAEQLPQ